MGKELNLDQIKNIKELLNICNFGENGPIVLDGDCTKQCYCKDKTNLIAGFCTTCENEKNDLNKPNDNFEKNDKDDYSLKNISHGTHTLDFFYSQHGEKWEEEITALKNWNDIPVLFLFENPSNDYNLYKTIKFNGMEKRPATNWYWISGDSYKEDELKYPNSLKQGYYGGMVYSLIKMFKLANAYVTNIVKCGMSQSDGNNYLATNCYKEGCIKKCIETHLAKEITALTKYNKNLIVFAFGKRVYNLITSYFPKIAELQDNTKIYLFPHPSNRLANDYRKYVLFGKTYSALKRHGVNCDKALEQFLDYDDAYL